MNTQPAQRMNGSNGVSDQQPVQINPVEVSKFALMFLSRCDLKPAERQAFAQVEMLLQAMAGGSVTLAAAQEDQPRAPGSGEEEPPDALQ